jgi:hypothetical protein
METKIKVSGDYKVIAGSTEWLKNQIENSQFRFTSTNDNEPCVCWDFFKEKEGKKVKVRSSIVAFIDSEYSDSMGWRSFSESCKITNPSKASRVYEEPGIFNYLTPNAEMHCDRLIKLLAEKLIQKVGNDYQSLKISVTVE